MKNKLKILSLILLFSLAAFLRLYHLDSNPPCLFSDEVDLGYQAYSFLKTGKDYFGNFLPISFHSFADWRASFYIYSAAGTISLFGLNEWGVRLPAAIFGILGIVAFFFLLKEISHNFKFSLLGAFILTILPWHLHYSRIGFEATATFFLITLGFLLFFKAIKKTSFFLLVSSLLVLSLNFYTYATARLFLPLLGLAVLIIYRKELLSFGVKKLGMVILIALIFCLPFLKDTFLGGGLFRFSYLNIFSDSNLKIEIGNQRLVDTVHGKDQTLGMSTPFFAKVFHNKPLSWGLSFLNNYLGAFSNEFLFLSGDPNLRHGIGKTGEVLVALAPFLLLGLLKTIMIIKAKGKETKINLFFLLFLILCPVSSAITYEGGHHATRLFLMIIPLTYLVTLGFFEFFSWFKERGRLWAAIFSLAFVSLNFIYWWHLYSYHYPLESERSWHCSLKESIKMVMNEEKNYDRVVISNSYESPLIFFLFWSQYDPKILDFKNLEKVKTVLFDGEKMGKFWFAEINTKSIKKNYQLLRNFETEKVLILAQRNDIEDLEKETPFYLKEIGKVFLPSKEPFFYLLKVDY